MVSKTNGYHYGPKLHFTSFIKLDSIWTILLTLKSEIIKYLEKSLRENLYKLVDKQRQVIKSINHANIN